MIWLSQTITLSKKKINKFKINKQTKNETVAISTASPVAEGPSTQAGTFIETMNTKQNKNFLDLSIWHFILTFWFDIIFFQFQTI